MAANDGTTAELFPGWSSVVHRPAEEPEEIDLPSTVDIAALTNTEPVNERTDSDDSDADSSNSDASESDSSDSEDSSSSSQGSSSRCSTPRSPEFAVTSSPTGLRLTIRKASATPEPPDGAAPAPKSASSSSDSSSSDSDSERSDRNRRNARRSPVRDNVRQTRRLAAKARARVAEKKDEKVGKNVVRKDKDSAAAGVRAGNVKLRSSVRRTRKMASLPLSRGSTYTTSDSEADSDADSAMLASCSLQEIRQEDLAAILPDQQEIDASGCGAGDASGSDMELPQQAVNALIQRTTESSSDGESNAQPLYANNLLQQFVAQMQLLNNAPCQSAVQASNQENSDGNCTAGDGDVQCSANGGKSEVEGVKKRRGRPKKCDKEADKSQEYCANPNVSPDSGIQNSPDHVSSPEPVVLSPTAKQKSAAKKIVTNNNNSKVKPVTRTTNNGSNSSKNKIPVTSTRFDRAMYGNTERVLYPPRKLGNARKGPGRPPKHKSDANKSIKEKKCKQEKQQQQQQQAKFQTLKIPKLMHSKRKHKKHKKYKIKIVKPLSHQHPKASTVEIDKLIEDFAAYCSIRHRDPAKKSTKKRGKAAEHGDKKKKRCDAVEDDKPADADEQRLPLKKRHYHHVNEEEESGRGDDHIDEAIEACINRYADKPTASIAATPKKRHRPEEKASDRADEITIESFITELKAKRNLTGKGEDEEDVATSTAVERERKEAVEEAVKASPESVKKKVRKRRAFNRTGFPTVRRKKKKPSEGGQTAAIAQKLTEVPDVCERVPKEGEQYSEFVQRTETSTVDKPKPDDPFKWEAMSECESLPQDERIDFDEDIKPDRMSLRHRDAASPSSSVEPEHSLESSIERLRSRLEERGKRKRRDKDKPPSVSSIAGPPATSSCSSTSSSDVSTNYPKRKAGEASPAGGVVDRRRLKDDRSSTSGDEKRARRSSRWRKKYLVAGLFSDYYKEGDEAIRLKRVENANKPTRILVYNPDEHPYGLLPPPYHCGRYLRCRKIPFQLPYDIWWQHTNSQLPGRDIVPSWNYRKIRSNIYNVKNSTGACEPQPCNCKPTSNCGDDCINRLVFAECPSSHRCNNQKIQKHEWKPGLEKFMTDAKGWGVRTKHPIKKGEFILEYVGEVVADQEFKERMGGVYANDTHHYCLHLDGGLVIDGHRMGSDGRFVNHSCDPNCEMQKWSVNGQFRMALFSLRDIEHGEELTYDYNFSLFNPAEGQECKCGSETCRGVIGGKSQRVRQLPEPAPSGEKKPPGRVGRPRKTEAKKKSNGAGVAGKEADRTAGAAALLPLVQIKPMSHQQKCFILEHHCFLLRNLAKVRKVRDRSMSASSRLQTATPTPTDTSVFMNQLNALQKPRNMKTRKLAQAEDDPELNKTIKLASLLKEIWTAVVTAKDSKGVQLSAELMSLPSKRKVPELYASLSNPIDLSIIEQNIATGVYKTPESFDADFELLFRNYLRFYGRTSDVGVAATKLKKIYGDSKRERLSKFEHALGEKPSPKFASNRKKSEEEDIIRCICGIPRDEGLMIQCERCMVWQHCECVKADASAASYHCENCTPRQVDYEIPLDEFTEHGHRYYMTLMRGDLQLRQGDTVYVLRDIPIKGTDKKHTYDTIGKIDYAELDIFRIERLWKEEKTGKRLAYGHHYLRPHETFHEPTRKFFPNEVMRVPLYEAVPVELIISHCWVMDLNTFCKGRPIGATPEHIYICEYRVDKGAKMFSKVSKSKFPICTKSFAFEHFETRLKISRTYCPHDVDESLLKNAAGRRQKSEEAGKPSARDKGGGGGGGGGSAATAVPKNETVVVATPPVVRTLVERKSRLNRILLNLLSKLPAKQVYDASYLLEGGRRRKKTADNNK